MNYDTNKINQTIFYIKNIVNVPVKGVDHEVQDGGNFLLINVHLESDISLKEMDELCDAVKQKLSGKLPTEEKEYSWMINFEYDGKVVGSVFSDLTI